MFTTKHYSFLARITYKQALSYARKRRRIDPTTDCLAVLERVLKITEQMNPNSSAIIGRIAAYITYSELA